MKPFAITLLFIVAFACLRATAQSSINNEVFKYKFKSEKNGARVSYVGKSHSFTFDLKASEIKELQAQGADDNMRFISVDKAIFQTSIVPMPQPIPGGLMLGSLSPDQQKEIIEGYVEYELDYYKQLGLKPIDLKKTWLTINEKAFMVWEFDVDLDKNQTGQTGEQAKGQVYLVTPCFNQMWVINMPLMDRKDHERVKNILTGIATSLKLYNTAQPQK